MNREIEIAKAIIISYLDTNLDFDSVGINLESLNELWEIRNNNRQVLLNHISALKNIFARAEEKLRSELKEM